MNIVRLELKNNFKGLLTWIISLSIIILILLVFFPSMQTEGMKSLTNVKMEGINPAILASLGLEVLVDFSILTNYFGYLFQFVALATTIFITQGAFNLLIKDEVDGTIEYIYSKPISRRKLFFSKLMSLIIQYAILIFVLFIISFILYLIYGDLSLLQSLKETSILFGGLYFIGLIYLAIGILLSMLVKTYKGNSGVGIGVVMFSFILGVLSTIVEKLDKLSLFIPIKWIEYQKVLNEGFYLKEITIGIFVVLIFIYISYKKYEIRDLLI